MPHTRVWVRVLVMPLSPVPETSSVCSVAAVSFITQRWPDAFGVRAHRWSAAQFVIAAPTPSRDGVVLGCLPPPPAAGAELADKLKAERVKQLEGRREVLSRFRKRNHRDSASSSDDEQPDHLKRDPDASESDEETGPLLPWQIAKKEEGAALELTRRRGLVAGCSWFAAAVCLWLQRGRPRPRCTAAAASVVVAGTLLSGCATQARLAAKTRAPTRPLRPSGTRQPRIRR